MDAPDPDTVEQLLKKLLTERAAAYDRIAHDVDSGRLPVGMLVEAVASTYTEALLFGLSRPFRTHWVGLDAQDLANAREAFESGGEIVVDLSSLATASLAPRLWPTVVALFHRVYAPFEASVDLLRGRDSIRERNTAAYLDPSTGRPAIVSVTAFSTPLGKRADWMWDNHTMLTWERVREPDAFLADPQEERAFAWLRSVHLAQERELPLLCDDLALRLVAEARGVKSFPLSQVLRLLRDRGSITDGEDLAAVTSIISAR